MALGNRILTSPPTTSSTPKPLLQQGRPWLLAVGKCRDGREREKGKASCHLPPHFIHQLTQATQHHLECLWTSGLIPPTLGTCPALLPLPLASLALALVPGGGEGPWAFPSSLPSRLETGSVFPGPAPFIRETMCAHSEGLVWHPSPKPFDLRNFSSADLSP